MAYLIRCLRRRQKMEGICRLCGKIKNRLIDMLSPEGRSHHLFEKIRAYINIGVSERDPFPKSVCMLCLGMLDYTCQFQDMCRAAQILFRRHKVLEEESARMASVVIRQYSTQVEVSLTGHNAYFSTFQDVSDDDYRTTSPAFVETSSVNGDVSIDEDNVHESWPNRSAVISESYNSDPSQMEQCLDATINLIKSVSPFESNDQDSVIFLPNNVYQIDSEKNVMSLPNNVFEMENENNKISFTDGSLVMTKTSEMPKCSLSKSCILLSSPPNEVRRIKFPSSQYSESSYNVVPCDAKAKLESKKMAKSSPTPIVAIPVKSLSPEPPILPTSLFYSAASNIAFTQNVSSPSDMLDICTAVASAKVPSWHESFTASSISPLTPVTTLGLSTTWQHESKYKVRVLQSMSTEDPLVLHNCDGKCISSGQIESLAFHTSFASLSVPKPVDNESTTLPQPSSESSASCVSTILKMTLTPSKPAQRDSLTSLAFVTNIREHNGGDDDNRTQTHSHSGVIEACKNSDFTPIPESAIESKYDYFEDRACGWKKYTVGDSFKRRTTAKKYSMRLLYNVSVERSEMSGIKHTGIMIVEFSSRINKRGSIYPKTVLSHLPLTQQLSRPSSTQLQILPKCCLSCNASATGSFSCCYELVSRRHLAFYCHACNQIFVKRRSYVDRPRKCTKCDKTFPDQPRLWKHNRKYHEKMCFSCNDCGKIFDVKSNLIKHINYIHLNMRNHKCSVCDKTFKRRRHLKDHMDRHTGTPRYVCPVCGLAYYTHGLLSNHKKRIHDTEKPHKCNECDSVFKTKHQLKLHQLVHTGEKPFCCDQCGKSFARSFTLNIHVKCVHMPKSISCPLCPSMFSHKSNLKTHLDYHARLENKTTKNKYVSTSVKKRKSVIDCVNL